MINPENATLVDSEHIDTSSEVENTSKEEVPRKKTKGRTKIPMKYIEHSMRRHSTFCKRKNGMMKKAHELEDLTNARVLLIISSETKHIYKYISPQLEEELQSTRGKDRLLSWLNMLKPEDETETEVGRPHQQASRFPEQMVIANQTSTSISIPFGSFLWDMIARQQETGESPAAPSIVPDASPSANSK